MPLYEFACQTCGTDFEALVLSASQVKEVTCPECKSQDVVKKVSLFAAKAPSGKSTAYWGGSSASSCTTST